MAGLVLIYSKQCRIREKQLNQPGILTSVWINIINN